VRKTQARKCQFGWLRGSEKFMKRKNFVVAGACNHPNCLVLPFSVELIRFAALSKILKKGKLKKPPKRHFDNCVWAAFCLASATFLA
jgi:hypothetical protein